MHRETLRLFYTTPQSTRHLHSIMGYLTTYTSKFQQVATMLLKDTHDCMKILVEHPWKVHKLRKSPRRQLKQMPERISITKHEISRGRDRDLVRCGQGAHP